MSVELPKGFSGSILIRHEGMLIVNEPISQEQFSDTNWLCDYGVYGRVWEDKKGVFGGGLLMPEETYELTVKYTPDFPPGTSLWLHWVTREQRN